MALKLDTNLPKTTGFKTNDVAGPATSPAVVETKNEPIKTGQTRFDGAQSTKSGAETGERADVQHAPAGNLGWGVTEVTGPVTFGGAADLKSAQSAVQRSLDGLPNAIAQLRAGADGAKTMDAASKVAVELWKAVSDYGSKNPLLPATDLAPVKQLIGTLAAAVKTAEVGDSQFKEAAKQAVISAGFQQVTDVKESWSEQSVAKELANKNSPTGLFYEQFGKLIVVQGGDASSAEARAKAAVEASQNQPGDVASPLRNAKQVLERRVEVTEAQFQPPRTNDEISQLSADYAKQNGYSLTSGAAVVGGAIQALANHQEILQFSGRMLQLSLETIDPKQEPDAGKRVDMALQRAQYWVNNYGRNERDLDAVWSRGLEQAAAALRGA